MKAKNRATIRRDFWMGLIAWNDALAILKTEYNMNMDEAQSFLGDSTNLDAAAKLQASLNVIPFGISLTQPSIML